MDDRRSLGRPLMSLHPETLESEGYRLLTAKKKLRSSLSSPQNVVKQERAGVADSTFVNSLLNAIAISLLTTTVRTRCSCRQIAHTVSDACKAKNSREECCKSALLMVSLNLVKTLAFSCWMVSSIACSLARNCPSTFSCACWRRFSISSNCEPSTAFTTSSQSSSFKSEWK